MKLSTLGWILLFIGIVGLLANMGTQFWDPLQNELPLPVLERTNSSSLSAGPVFSAALLSLGAVLLAIQNIYSGPHRPRH
jgi:hypothetical protein